MAWWTNLCKRKDKSDRGNNSKKSKKRKNYDLYYPDVSYATYDICYWENKGTCKRGKVGTKFGVSRGCWLWFFFFSWDRNLTEFVNIETTCFWILSMIACNSVNIEIATCSSDLERLCCVQLLQHFQSIYLLKKRLNLCFQHS